MSGEHDATLDAAAHGDDDALAILVRRYHDRVHHFGLRVCRDGFDADDAVQEAFIKLGRRPDVARDPSALSWLMSVVRNACLRLMRPLMRERVRLGDAGDELALVPSTELDPEAALSRWRLVHAVHQAIAALPPAYREVLVLRDVEGLGGDEVCAMLGIGSAAMKSRLLRARAQVRESVQASEEKLVTKG